MEKLLDILWEIRILPASILAEFTGPRYLPSIEWASKNWTHNAFRAFELIFGRKYGIRPELSTWTSDGRTYYAFHTIESLITHIESCIRTFRVKIPVRVHVPMLVTPHGFRMFSSPYLFAIAYNTSSTANVTIGTTSVSTTHTASGSDRLAVAISWCGTSQTVTTTYDGVSMGSPVTTTTRADSGIYNRIYVLVAPSTTAGATVSFTVGVSDNLGGYVTTFTGCSQVSQPDGSDGVLAQADGTSASSNITVTASDCWVTGLYINDNTAANGCSGTGAFVTRRAGTWGASFSGVAFCDSNGSVSTGSIAYGGSSATSGGQTLAAVSISPAGAAATSVPRRRMLLGIGR